MKIILVGYPGSQCIVPVSKYLTSKYLKGFDIRYVNYKGDVNKWSSFVAGYLSSLDDFFIIFALDDYLIANEIEKDKFQVAVSETQNDDVVCVKLCYSTEQEHLEYPVTTQYCIWNREYLIELLGKVNTPWQFEVAGSQFHFDKISLHRPCLDYFTNSAISARWCGVRLDGLKQEDILYINQTKLL